MSRERSQFSRIAWVITLGFLVLWLAGHTVNAHERMLLGTRTFALAMVERTLGAMRAGGIYDHVGFGFHR